LRAAGFRAASTGLVLIAFFAAVRITLNPVSAKPGLGVAPGHHTHKHFWPTMISAHGIPIDI
jgi:hypothetical protein